MNVRHGNWFRHAGMRAVRGTAVVLIAALGVACPGGSSSDDQDAYGHVMSFDTTRVRLTTDRDTVPVQIELAVSPEQRQMGLMERRQLAENAGMLFVYDSMQPADAGFWMFRTRIPLDIAFLDSVGTIRSIKSMVPCPTDISQGCPTYPPDARYQYALEMNAGFFTRHGIRVGHSLVLPDLADRATPRPR
jgi:uncharacterized membrane protein (UPF0127 family)